jgi:CheY-like chemotaxis protein
VGQIQPGGYVVISVRDTGHGMDEATRKKIFDAFFTTKTAGEGTGLGLALTQSIVSNHGGAIRIHSRPGQGSTFEIFLPEASLDEQVAEPPVPVLPGDGERVGVLDDESSIASFIAVRLEQLNYRPQVLKNPHQALALLLETPSRFDVLVTDYSMPGMTGVEVLKRMRSAGIRMPALVTSGDDTPALQEEVKELGAVHLLTKPFTGEQLAQGIRTALALKVES